MNKLSKKAQQFLKNVSMPKAQMGTFASTAFPYIMQPATQFAAQVAPSQPIALDNTSLGQGQELNLQGADQLIPQSTTRYVPPTQPREKSTVEQVSDSLGMLSPALKIGVGIKNFVEGQREKRIAKFNEKMFKEDYMDRKEQMRDSFYTTPYTVGRSSDYTAKYGTKVMGEGGRANKIVLYQNGGMSAFEDYYNSMEQNKNTSLDMFKDIYKQTVQQQKQAAKLQSQEGLSSAISGVTGMIEQAKKAASMAAGVPMKEGGKISRMDLLDYSMKMQQGGSILDSIWNTASNTINSFMTPDSFYTDQQKKIELDSQTQAKKLGLDKAYRTENWSPTQIKTEINQVVADTKAAMSDDNMTLKRPAKFDIKTREHELGGEVFELIEARNGYKVERSNQRKGKTHKVTGPDGTVKFFGDSKLGQHPGDPDRKKAFYARHKENLKNNPYFRAFARKTWQDGGEIEPDLYDQDFQGVDNSGSKMEAILAEQELMQQENSFDEAVNQYAVQRNEDNLYNGQSTSGNSEALKNSNNVIDKIAYNESRGRYDVVNTQTNTVGKYQFMQKYWADPIRKFMKLPPTMPDDFVMESFKNSPATQDKFMQHVVQNIYMPEVEKVRPLAQKYGLTDDDVIRLMHYRGVGETKQRLQSGNFEVSKAEQKKYNNPTIEQYLGKSIN